MHNRKAIYRQSRASKSGVFLLAFGRDLLTVRDFPDFISYRRPPTRRFYGACPIMRTLLSTTRQSAPATPSYGVRRGDLAALEPSLDILQNFVAVLSLDRFRTQMCVVTLFASLS